LFTLDGKEFPARLVNLPCNLETMKTLDNTSYFKSGDVGQMLVVYEVSFLNYVESVSVA
jgi:TATA-binding protein-associated factor Taf7